MDRTTHCTRTYREAGIRKEKSIPSDITSEKVLRALWLISVAVFAPCFLLTVFTGFYPFLVASGISGFCVISLGLMSEYLPAERFGFEKKLIAKAKSFAYRSESASK